MTSHTSHPYEHPSSFRNTIELTPARSAVPGVPNQEANVVAMKANLSKGIYPVSVVGESHYQMEIAIARVGESTVLFHEPNNSYDAEAVAVVRAAGGTIGYLPRGHWLKTALLDEGKGVTVDIGEIGRSDGGLLGVGLFVTFGGSPISKRIYRR